MAIRVLTVAFVFLVAACSGSDSPGGGDVNPTTNINLDEGIVSVLNEGQVYELIPGGGTGGGSDVVEWRWSNNPVNAGALPACSNANGFKPQLAAQRLDAACTDATQCSIDFDQKQSADGAITFDLSIPVLKASIGLTYQLTAVNAAQQPTVGNFTFCLIAVNEAPSATNDVFTATEGTALTISASTGLNLLSNDTDDDDLSNKPLAVNPIPVTPPTLATEFSLQTDGGFSYLYVGAADVPAGQTLTDSFTYEITDGFTPSSATVTINIGTSDKPPRAIDAIPDQSIVVGVEKPFDLSTFFVDPENGELIFAAVRDTLPSAGDLSISELGEFRGTAAVDDVGEYTVRFTVSDQVSASEATNAPLEASFKLVVNPNQAPTVATIEDVKFESGDLVSLDLAQYFSDAESQPLTYSVLTDPTSTLQINESSGLLTGQLSVAGSYVVTVSANDGINSPVTQTFTIEQLPSANLPPVLEQEPADVQTTIGVAMTPISAAFSDPEKQPLVYAINTLPEGLSFDVSKGELSGIPTALGNYNLRFSATDAEGASTLSNTFLLQVIAVPNRPPEAGIVIKDQVIAVNTAMQPATANFTDPDGDTIEYQISPSLDGLLGYTFVGGTLAGTPSKPGATVFTITASDGTATVQSNPFTITVNAPTNNAPVQGQGANTTDQSIILESAITDIDGKFTDPDGDTLSYTIAPPVAGSGLTFSPTTGILSGVPLTAGNVGYVISASDGTAVTQSSEFTITVTANPTPVAGGPIQNQTITLGDPITPINGGFTDADPITYSIVPSVAQTGLVFNTTTGTLTGTPLASGPLSFRIRASDGTTAALSNQFIIQVDEPTPANTAPVQGTVIIDQTVKLGNPITDINGGFTDTEVLGYALDPALPATSSLSFGAVTGTLSGIPDGVGSITYKIIASDGTLSTDSNLFTVTVEEANRAPVVGLAATLDSQTVVVDTPVTVVSGDFSDPDNDPMTFSIAPLASTAGLLFDAATGELTGEPSVTGTYSFVITASDGELSTPTPAVSIVVTSPPVIAPPPVPVD